MAKRAPADETTYNPLDMTLAQSVVRGAVKIQDEKTASAERAGEYAVENPPHAAPHAHKSPHLELPARASQQASPNVPLARSLNREKRVMLTPEEERQIERLVDRIGEQLSTSLKLSHLLRACMTVLCHAEEELLRHSSELHSLPRPGNGEAVALVQFEQVLARLLSKSLRDAPAIR